MNPVTAAVMALLADRPCHWLEAPAEGLTYPYRLVWPSTATPGPDETLAGVRGHLSALLGVTSVGATPEAASAAAAAARTALGEHAPVDLAADGWTGTVRWEAFGTARRDRDVPLLATNTYPCIYVDLYRVDATKTVGGL